MAQQIIGIGTVPNDGTGDTIRVAMTKTNNNFSDIYASVNTATSNGTAYTLGNSTVNASLSTLALNLIPSVAYTVNTTGEFIGNSTYATSKQWSLANSSGNVTINTTSVAIGVLGTTNGVFINTTTISVGNNSVNTFSNATHFFSGNSTYYGLGNSQVEAIVSPNGNSTINATSIAVLGPSGNSTANLLGFYTTGVVAAASANVSTNTFTFGTSNIAGHTVALAPGYTRIPNGLLMQFGTAAVNSTASIVTFSSVSGAAFTTNCFSLTITSNTVSSGVAAYSVNATAFTAISNSTSTSTINWLAIGV